MFLPGFVLYLIHSMSSSCGRLLNSPTMFHWVCRFAEPWMDIAANTAKTTVPGCTLPKSHPNSWNHSKNTGHCQGIAVCSRKKPSWGRTQPVEGERLEDNLCGTWSLLPPNENSRDWVQSLSHLAGPAKSASTMIFSMKTILPQEGQPKKHCKKSQITCLIYKVQPNRNESPFISGFRTV